MSIRRDGVRRGFLAVLGFTLFLGAVRAQVIVSPGGGGSFAGGVLTAETTIPDDKFFILGSADATKKQRFEVDGHTTGVTRVATFPNADITVAGTNLTNVFANHQMVSTDQILLFGTSVSDTFPNIRLSSLQTPDTGILATGSIGNSWLIVESGDTGFDFAHALQTNPTLFIHSANQSTTQWLSLTHSNTTGIIGAGSGGVGFMQPGSFDIAHLEQNGVVLPVTSAIGWSATGTAISGTRDTAIKRYSADVVAFGSSSGIRGFQGGGAAVASAAALPLPTGRVFHVTGTTTVTSITSTNFASGAVITLIFDGILTFTDGSNLVLAGNLVTTANDTITLVYDGTNWYETGRAVN